MLNFVLLVVIVAGGVLIAQLLKRMRNVEQRLRALEMESLNRGEMPAAPSMAPPIQRTVPPVRRSATIVQSPPPESKVAPDPTPIAAPIAETNQANPATRVMAIR